MVRSRDEFSYYPHRGTLMPVEQLALVWGAGHTINLGLESWGMIFTDGHFLSS